MRTFAEINSFTSALAVRNTAIFSLEFMGRKCVACCNNCRPAFLWCACLCLCATAAASVLHMRMRQLYITARNANRTDVIDAATDL